MRGGTRLLLNDAMAAPDNDTDKLQRDVGNALEALAAKHNLHHQAFAAFLTAPKPTTRGASKSLQSVGIDSVSVDVRRICVRVRPDGAHACTRGQPVHCPATRTRTMRALRACSGKAAAPVSNAAAPV